MNVIRLSVAIGFLVVASAALQAAPVEYVRVCDAFGAGFFYVPGTDYCTHAMTGDTRVATEGGVWRTRLPYPAGSWARYPRRACGGARLVKVGTFSSTDFTVNAWLRKQTAAIPLQLQSNEFISKVIMSGGFYDPRTSTHRSGSGLGNALCLRALDPSIPEAPPAPPEAGAPLAAPPKFRWANGLLPIACVPMSRLLNMPASYVVDADTAFPSVEAYHLQDETTTVSGSYTYDSHLAVTTDLGPLGDYALTYQDGTENKPMAGTVTVSACVAPRISPAP